MAKRVLFGLVSGLALFFSAGEASANYPGSIPNGYNGGSGRCYICHVDPAGGGTRTAFGEDFRVGPDGVAYNSDDHVWSTWLAQISIK